MMTRVERKLEIASEPVEGKTYEQFVEAAHAFNEAALQELFTVNVDFKLRDEDGLCIDGTLKAIKRAEHNLISLKHMLSMAQRREDQCKRIHV